MKLAMFGFVMLAAVGSMRAQQTYPFQNPALPAEDRITNLLSLMTREEKIDFFGMSENIDRLGIHAEGSVPTIPGSGGQFEGLHGVTLGGPLNWGKRSPGGAGEHGGDSVIATTQFPQAAGLGETWDPVLVRQAAEEEGKEARFVFQSYDRGGLIVRAPNADLARDPRWGRSDETYGEDPFLTGTMAVAYVRGLQGTDSKYWLTISLMKHFLANSNEDNRTGSSSNFDARLLHEYYAMPFRMAIEDGKSNALMVSYNAVNGIPMTANPMLRNMVMAQWGFNGLVDTDRGSLTNMVTKHKYYPDMEHSVAGAIHAGVNQFLNEYTDALHKALDDKLVTEADLDANLRGVFRVLLRAGLLDHPAQSPYTRLRAQDMAAPWDAPEVKALALQLTRESIVLLKNDKLNDRPVLPLRAAEIKSIAVVGPRADKVYSDLYGGTPPFAITPLEGIQKKVGAGVSVRFSQDHDQAVALARSSDVAIVVIGNDPTCGEAFGKCSDPSEGKEAIDRKQIALNPQQEKLVEDVAVANRRTVVVLVSGFPFSIDWEQQHVPAIVHLAHSSEEEGAALADVLFGDYNPAGRLVVTWPASLAQLPPMMDYNLRDGRTYMYFRGQPLYPFGFGLSYTSFKYSNLRLSSSHLADQGAVTVKVDVENSGTTAGDEVVQMYVSHEGSKVARPHEELKGFERIHLQSGERKTVQFRLTAESLGYWDEQKSGWTVEPDRVAVSIGSSSADIRLKRRLTVTSSYESSAGTPMPATHD